MADASFWEYTDGIFALALVDKEAVGYSEDWMAPSGLTADAVTLDSYDMPDGTSWYCQVTKAQCTPTAQAQTRSRPATMCTPASSTTSPQTASWALDVDFAQDAHIKDGLTRFLFENDAEEAYFVIGLDATRPPKVVGRCYLTPTAIGGTLGEDLMASVSMPLPRKPSAEFGTVADSEVVD